MCAFSLTNNKPRERFIPPLLPRSKCRPYAHPDTHLSPYGCYVGYTAFVNTSTLVSELDKQIARLREARNLLAGESGKTRRVSTAKKKPAKKRVLSAEARAKMAAAQKRRWAKQRKAAK